MSNHIQRDAAVDGYATEREQAYWDELYRTVDNPSVAAVLVKNLLDQETVGAHRALYLRVLVTLEKRAARQRRLQLLAGGLLAVPRAIARILRPMKAKGSDERVERLRRLLEDPALAVELAEALDALRVAGQSPADPGRVERAQAA